MESLHDSEVALLQCSAEGGPQRQHKGGLFLQHQQYAERAGRHRLGQLPDQEGGRAPAARVPTFADAAYGERLQPLALHAAAGDLMLLLACSPGLLLAAATQGVSVCTVQRCLTVGHGNCMCLAL